MPQTIFAGGVNPFLASETLLKPITEASLRVDALLNELERQPLQTTPELARALNVTSFQVSGVVTRLMFTGVLYATPRWNKLTKRSVPSYSIRDRKALTATASDIVMQWLSEHPRSTVGMTIKATGQLRSTVASAFKRAVDAGTVKMETDMAGARPLKFYTVKEKIYEQ